MAIPTSWYLRTGASDLNSGGTDADAPVINGDAGTPFVVTGGVDVEYAPGGINALAGTEGINLQVAGVSTIRGFTVVDDTHFTLDAAVANASYAGRIGGARVKINLVVGSGAGENAKIGSHHVYLEPAATFTETSIVMDAAVRLHLRGATISGTGGGAGTDILSCGIAINAYVEGGVLANAVDRGYTSNQGGTFYRMRAQSCGGHGFAVPSPTKQILNSARACGGDGFADQSNNEASAWFQLEAVDCTGAGIRLNRGGSLFACLAADCGGGGAVIGHDVAGNDWVVQCTFEGNTGPGLSYTGNLGGAHISINNVFTENTTYGCSAASDLSGTAVVFDWNHYHGNDTAPRNNVPTGDNDSSGDPEWVDVANDDYTPGPDSPLINAGYNHLKASLAPNKGATVHAAGSGSAAVPRVTPTPVFA